MVDDQLAEQLLARAQAEGVELRVGSGADEPADSGSTRRDVNAVTGLAELSTEQLIPTFTTNVCSRSTG